MTQRRHEDTHTSGWWGALPPAAKREVYKLAVSGHWTRSVPIQTSQNNFNRLTSTLGRTKYTPQNKQQKKTIKNQERFNSRLKMKLNFAFLVVAVLITIFATLAQAVPRPVDTEVRTRGRSRRRHALD